MLYIVDTYAWVEYFRGTVKGSKFNRIIQNDNNSFITPECCVFELKCWTQKDNLDFEKILQVVKSISKIEPISYDDWIKASKIRHFHRKKIKDFGLVDSLIVAMKEKHKSMIISGDKHFKTLKDVYYIGD